MAASDSELKSLLDALSSGVSSMLARQEEFSGKMDALEARLRRVEEGAYDYRVLLNVRSYVIEDVQGARARMESVRRCAALRRLTQLRTRYHTGSGEREASYDYRLLREEEGGKGGWTPIERRVEEAGGADYSTRFPLPEPIRQGEAFELRHRTRLRGAFTARNEWVTLVVGYPTEAFRLEVLLPAGRKVAGARREES